GVVPYGAAVARVAGRHMERLIRDGAAIGFDTSLTHVVDGEIYDFNQDGMLRVKYLYSMPGNSVRVRSDNSDEYPAEILTSDRPPSVVFFVPDDLVNLSKLKILSSACLTMNFSGLTFHLKAAEQLGNKPVTRRLARYRRIGSAALRTVPSNSPGNKRGKRRL
ncbi:S24 family peptidase, partial [Pseudomonas aeruginosa]